MGDFLFAPSVMIVRELVHSLHCFEHSIFAWVHNAHNS